jgi:hypothetical protein
LQLLFSLSLEQNFWQNCIKQFFGDAKAIGFVKAESTFGEHDARCLHSYPPAGIASLNEKCRSYELAIAAAKKTAVHCAYPRSLFPVHLFDFIDVSGVGWAYEKTPHFANTENRFSFRER